jgi:hypothetical protein
MFSGNIIGVVGITLTGVPIFAGTSEANVDPFYPNPNAPPYYQDKVDSCLGNVSPATPFYHFYTFSPCMIASPQKSSSSGSSCQSYGTCGTNTASYMVGDVS